jgi:hypothetical protein
LDEVDEEEEEGSLQILQPVTRPVLKPAISDTRKVLEPIEIEHRILSPKNSDDTNDDSNQPEVTVLKPVGRTVLKPVESSKSEEEE